MTPGRKLILYGIGLVVVALVVLSLVAGVNRVLSYVPFTPQWGERTAQREAVRSVERARELEAEGQAEQALRTDTYHHEVITIQTQAAQTEAQLRSLPDADAPIDPARLDRLNAADRELCETSPGICAPADAPARR